MEVLGIIEYKEENLTKICIGLTALEYTWGGNPCLGHGDVGSIAASIPPQKPVPYCLLSFLLLCGPPVSDNKAML